MSSTQAPLFSVIILCYNNSRYAYDCIKSILLQDYPEIEIIFADDASKEFNANEIEEYTLAQKRDNLKFFSVYQNPINFGTVKSINTALRRAHGVYFKLLAADDALYDTTVLSQAKKALDESAAGAITSKVMKCDPTLQRIGILNNAFQSKMNEMATQECYKQLCIHNDIVAPGAFFSKKFFERWGDFDEKYCLLEDWPLWLKVFRTGERIVYADFISVNYRSDVGNATSANPKYLEDKQKTFESEVLPFAKQLGANLIIKATVVLWIRNSNMVRKLYAMLFRRNNT